MFALVFILPFDFFLSFSFFFWSGGEKARYTWEIRGGEHSVKSNGLG